jgi:hypothetical protein
LLRNQFFCFGTETVDINSSVSSVFYISNNIGFQSHLEIIQEAEKNNNLQKLERWIEEKKQLREKENKLRDQAKQLRDKEMFLLQQTGNIF